MLGKMHNSNLVCVCFKMYFPNWWWQHFNRGLVMFCLCKDHTAIWIRWFSRTEWRTFAWRSGLIYANKRSVMMGNNQGEGCPFSHACILGSKVWETLPRQDPSTQPWLSLQPFFLLCHSEDSASIVIDEGMIKHEAQCRSSCQVPCAVALRGKTPGDHHKLLKALESKMLFKTLLKQIRILT